MYFKRIISDKIRALSQSYPAVVVTGARQVGKTTLLKELFPKHHYLSLDLPSVAEAAETEPRSFLENHPVPLIIDEVQYAPKLFRGLKSFIDRDRHQMGRYILTGSQKFPLMKEVADSLAGRAAIVQLEPLSLAELGQRDDWGHLLARGLYPELWRQPTMSAGDFYASYLATYLERDVRQILNVSSLRDFERFLRAAAARSGQLLNKSELGKDVGVASKTIGEWLSVLEASNQIALLEPYFENVGKRLVKSPKLYLCDPGLLCFLLGLDEPSLPRSPLVGAIWETFVYAELRKRAAATGSASQSFWFYRDAQGREIDFLRLQQGQLDLLECKWSEQPEPRWSAKVDEIARILSESKISRLGQAAIVCRTPHSYLTYPAHPGDQRRKAEIRVINPNDLT